MQGVKGTRDGIIRKRRPLRPDEPRPEGKPYRTHDSMGYVVLSWPVGSDELVWIREHRLVAKAADGMQVHHLDGNKVNNDPANLVLLTPSEHSTLHARRKFDRETAAELYRSGLSTPQIAKVFGVNGVTVLRGLRTAGVDIRSVSEAGRLRWASGRRSR